ncbi:MAG: DUF6750 family protein [Gammaproteobacteria bacterium]|jgi:intracellular multiplication protein IcmD
MVFPLRKIKKSLGWISIIAFCFYIGCAFAADSVVAASIADIANNITKSFENIGRLMLATSYLAGIGFTIASIFKFKQHRDNPTQIPIGTPIALLMIAVILIFLPGIIKPVGFTIFGTGADLKSMAGGFTGNGACGLPGSSC